MIQVDHGVPIPPRPRIGRRKGASGKPQYPWLTMEVGDSFIFPITLHRAWARISDRRKFDRRTYEARELVEDGVNVVRIWRVA